MITVNLLSYDYQKYDCDQVGEMCTMIKNALPDDNILIVMPKGCDFYHDVPLDLLYCYRQTIDSVIKQKETGDFYGD